MALGDRGIVVLARPGDDDGLGACVLEGAHHGSAGAARPQHEAGSAGDGLKASHVALAEATQEPGKAVEVRVVAADAAVLRADERVDGPEPLCGSRELVAQRHHVALVGDGDVKPLPMAFAHVVCQLVGLELHELVGRRTEPLVDLRAPAVAKGAPEEAIAHGRAVPLGLAVACGCQANLALLRVRCRHQTSSE